jgi:methylated-DNA-[protein]-cysteine S-methyltransferase
MKNLYFKEINSVLGKLRIICDDDFIIRLLFENDNLDRSLAQLSGIFGGIQMCHENAQTDACAKELRAYLTGNLKEFTVKPALYGTEFDKKVWQGLTQIPYGQTETYAGLGKLCHVKGARAVGGAVGRNPVPLIVPCHRVIRSDGGLGGFRGGLENKIALLKIEGVAMKSK